MRKMVVVCDACGSEVASDPIQVFAEKVDLRTGNFTSNPSFYAPEFDFCGECFEKIKQALDIMTENNEQHEKTEADPQEIQEQKVEPVQPDPAIIKNQDKLQKPTPTVKELLLAGKTAKEVVEITGCKLQTIHQVRYQIKKELETAGSDEPVKTVNCDVDGKSCKYSQKISANGKPICDYLSREGKSRGCSPRECTRYIKSGK